MAITRAIIGLGNPGKAYAETRHNVGFMVIDALSQHLGIPVSSPRFKGLVGEGIVNGQKVILLKPQTYMNLSGESVRPLIDWYKIPLEEILVIYDDLDLPAGKIRLRLKGSSGGHNGIKSIIQHVGDSQFKRIRIGIGRPPEGWSVPDYVLSKFSDAEWPEIERAIQSSVEAVKLWFQEPFDKVMSIYNAKFS